MNVIKSKYLDQLLADFQLMSKIVLSQIGITRKLLSGGENAQKLYDDVERNENLIDGLEVKIREEVINAILLFTPRATDLRKIMAYHDMTIYLERIGDLLLNVVHSISRTNLSLPGFEEFTKLLEKMLKHAEKMVQNAVLAFSCEDNTIAYKTIALDDKLDDFFKEIRTKLPECFAGKDLSVAELQNIIHVNSISYNVERVGDNATNIAEAAIYLTEGKDIRHTRNQ